MACRVRFPPGSVKSLRVFSYQFAYQEMGAEPYSIGLDGPWEMIDNGANKIEIVVAALLRVGYSPKMAWTIAENDKYAFDFYMDITYCRERVYDYHKKRISYLELLASMVAFCVKNFYRWLRGSVVSGEFLSTESLDEMAGAGLEPATLRL